MKLRLRGLTDVDPLAVPLPNGTEVTTRVDRLIGERKVKQGAVGRVFSTTSTDDGDLLEVDILGVGRGTYRREELVPRKTGQLRFAARRAAAWEALSGCVVLDALVGSRAWGLANADSDSDRRGIFVLPFSWTTALVEPPLDLVSTDGSSTFWELGKALRQAIRADPNTLEIFFVADIDIKDPMGQWLLDARDALVSAEIYGSFGRYALSQLKKLRQSQRLAEHREEILSWLRADPSLELDVVADRLARDTEIQAPTEADARLRAKEYIKQLYSSLFDRGALTERNFAALARFAAAPTPGFEMPRDLRPKNAYNLLRLIGTAIEWLETGEPRLEVTGPLRDRLLAIKAGEVPLTEVLDEAAEMTTRLETARKGTPLPERADVTTVDRLLRRIRSEAARRFVEAEPGPWGADAPQLPEAAWQP
jgi:hypothetical protein